MPTRWLRALSTLALVLVTSLAFASDRVDFLAQRLKYPPPSGLPDDFRVRTQAALNLGGTDDDDAVEPLCDGLADPSAVVRHSSAVALKRLGRASALACLKARRDVEGVASVKVQIVRSIEALEGAGGGSTNANARFYVALGPVSNNTNRPRAEIERLVKDAIAAKLGQAGGYQLAPSGESPDAARGVISSRNLKGYYLSAVVEPFNYSGGGLRVRVKIAVFTYPGKDLKGESPAAASVDGVQQGDHGTEDMLLKAVADAAADGFTKGFQ